MDYNKTLFKTANVLVLLGAVNWGLIGLFSFDLVNTVLVGFPQLERLLYIFVGASALYLLGTHKRGKR